MTTILHVDMDAFYASIEQRDHPALRGKPVVVGSPPNRRGVVSTASYEARVYGIRSAMPSRTAGKLCPHATFRPVDMARYRAVSNDLMAIFESYSAAVEPLSIDEAFLDLSGTRLLWPDPVALARDMKRRIQDQLQLTASAGLAPNKFLAKLASDLNKPDGLTVVPTEPAAILAFLAPMPVSRIWGVGKAGEKRLHRFGLHTMGDVHQQADHASLCRWLGASFGRHVWCLAHGLDDRAVETEREAKSISAEHTYDQDCRDPERVRQTLIELTEKVGWRLRRAGLWAGTGHLKLRDADFNTLSRQQSLRGPTHADADLLDCALRLYDQARGSAPVRLIGFGAGHLSGAQKAIPVQTELFEDAHPPKGDALDRAVDSVRDRFGRGALKRGGP